MLSGGLQFYHIGDRIFRLLPHLFPKNERSIPEMIYALILFAVTYVLMLTFQKYRPYIALGSAVLFIVTGMLPLNEIWPAIDKNVLLMIAGTMGLVALFIESKMPELLADIIDTYADMQTQHFMPENDTKRL